MAFLRSGGIALFLLALTACGPNVPMRDGSTGPDAGPPPPVPTLDPVPTPVPYTVATLRGRAPESRRILVRGSDNPIASAVLPDGTFCVDVPMPNPDSYAFEVLGQNQEGVFSEGSAMTTVVFDPASAPVPGLTTCSGMDPAGCAAATEICDNGRDDDCNGLADIRDPACSDCVDDVFEPNDDVGAPRADPGRYEGLAICPGNTDYYGIYARAGDTLRATIFFSHASGDLDMELLGTDRSTVLMTSASMDDDEVVTLDVTETGEYKLRVWGPSGSMNGYTLDVDVTSP
jgi:hypothetical protein